MAEIHNGGGAAATTPARAGRTAGAGVAQAQRRAALLAAADQVVKRHGADTSASLIAREAGVTKPIIYRHFDDIDDLYRELGEKYRADLADFMLSARQPDLDRAGRYRAVVDAFFRAVEDYPNVFRFVMQKALSKETPLSWFTHGWASDTATYFMQEAGQTRSSLRSSIVGFAVVGAIQTAASHWLQAGGSRSEAVDALVDVLLNGLPDPVQQVSVADYPCQVGVSEANLREQVALDTGALDGDGPAPADLTC